MNHIGIDLGGRPLIRVLPVPDQPPEELVFPSAVWVATPHSDLVPEATAEPFSYTPAPEEEL